MDNQDGIVTPEGLNFSIHLLNKKDSLPLAAARNRGMAAAKTNNLIFIDVDGIVSPTLFANMLVALTADNLIAAYPLYLPVLPDNGNYKELKPKAVPHPARQDIPVGEPVHHLQFWSLIFAIQKQRFEKIGGFDESFEGYGAEDTDFAMMFHRAGIQQIFVEDYMLHQYHDKYDPPLNHFEAIIKNATRYREKWGVLPMQRWLKAFEAMGLIKIEEAGNIKCIQKPTALQIENSFSRHPY